MGNLLSLPAARPSVSHSGPSWACFVTIPEVQHHPPGSANPSGRRLLQERQASAPTLLCGSYGEGQAWGWPEAPR